MLCSESGVCYLFVSGDIGMVHFNPDRMFQFIQIRLDPKTVKYSIPTSKNSAYHSGQNQNPLTIMEFSNSRKFRLSSWFSLSGL